MEVCAAAVQAWMTTQAALIVICQLEAAEGSPAAVEAIIKVTVATLTALGVVLADPGTLLKAIILYITVPDLPLLSSRHPSLR